MVNRIFLIANNPNIDKHIIKRSNRTTLSDNDIVVRFNHVEKPTRKLFNERTDWLAIREKPHGPYYSGITRNKSLIYDNTEIKQYCFIGNRNPKNIVKKNGMKNAVLINKKQYDKHYKIKSVSSGFAIINFMLENFPKYRIILIGFDFHKNDNQPWHEFRKEKLIVNSMIRKKGLNIRMWT